MKKKATKKPRIFLLVSLVGVISSCSYPINKVEINAANLVDTKSIGKLSCSYRLIAVNDLRPEGSKAGGLGLNKLSFSEPTDFVKAQLVKAGMLPENSVDGRGVVVDIKYVYINQNVGSKIPTVVYEVQLDKLNTFVIRGQIASMNWTGNEDEIYNAFKAAFQSANTQLIAKLNKICVN